MSKISAVIITFNEENNIERCVNSLNGVVDEIIVLDSFSSDKTPEICKRLNVRFKQHAFDGHIEQKNRVMNMASYDYVLSLDADEFLSDELKSSILQIKSADFTSDAYYFNRLNYYCGKAIKHGAWYPDKKIRLWNKNKGKWGGKNPHDTVILQNYSNKIFLSGDLNHYSFLSVNQHVEQINKFSLIKAQNDFHLKKKPSVFKMILKPLYKFLIAFFFKAGFLDGFYGFVVAINSSHAEFLRHAKLKELYKNEI
ncbi:MAG: glycosyltransferase family 2 protein [Bacteroidales bacterium]|nr:glycosyltransferase family 2 protein [Bacteroidales bacterium]